MMIRTYHHLCQLKTFEERYEYLRLRGKAFEETFGINRYLNQALYHSDGRWKSARNQVIIRDDGCDLGVEGYTIEGRVYVHHINPITQEQIENNDSSLFDPEFLICTSFNTHQAIHYGDSSLLPKVPIERKPWDTCPWRKH